MTKNVFFYGVGVWIGLALAMPAWPQQDQASSQNQTGSGLIMHGAHKHRQDDQVEAPPAELEKQVGVDERLGQSIDLNLTFRDEAQRTVRLGDYIVKPTIILPVYFYCPQACSTMLADLAQALNDVPLNPGDDYQVLAVSFDEHETPATAREAKANYFNLITRDFAEQNWKFLTGEYAAIAGLMQGFGYRFKRTGPHMFVHPNALVVVAPDGKIIRYLYGLRFLPFDIGMAVTEAAQGTPQISIRRVLTYCFDYDSKTKRYVFKSFRVAAAVILLTLAVFLIFLLRKGKTPPSKSVEQRRGATHDRP